MKRIETTTSPPFVVAVQQFWSRLVFSPWGHARAQLYQEIASLLGAGVGPREALDRLVAHHGTRVRSLLLPLAGSVQAGEPLSRGMAAHPERFTALEQALVMTGERSGRLDQAFVALSNQAEVSFARLRRIVLSTLYPLFLLHFALIVPPIGFILVSRGMGAYLGFVIPALVSLWLLFLVGISLHAGFRERAGYAQFLLSVPFVGRALQAGAVSQFTGALGTLHAAGMASHEALSLAANASGNAWMRAELGARATVVRDGHTLSEALIGARSIPSEVVSVIATGEHSGDLEVALAKTARLYGERFDVAAKALPGVLFVLGVVLVGMIVMGMALNLVSTITSQY